MNYLYKFIFLIGIWLTAAIGILIAIVILPFARIKKNSSGEKKRIAIFPAFFPGNAGFQWRVANWTDILRTENIEVDIYCLWDKRMFEKYALGENELQKLYLIWKRLAHFFKAAFKTDIILIRREILPYFDEGRGFSEKILSILFKIRILDFDDHIASAKNEPRKVSLFGKLLGMQSRPFTNQVHFYNYFIVGNNFLKDFLVKEGLSNSEKNNILILPTCYPVQDQLRKSYDARKKNIVIGWIGSNGNQYTLDYVMKPLNSLFKTHNIELRVISGKHYENNIAEFKISNVTWSLETERQELLQCDIGIMPLPGNPHEFGKSAFKLIQYMSLGIVSIASDVGANKDVIEDEINGYLVRGNRWKETLFHVFDQQWNWPNIGRVAQETIKEKYSFEAHSKELIDFLLTIK